MVRMKDWSKESFFPREQDIPEEITRYIPVRMDRYLAGGTFVKWGGPFRDVTSPVSVRGGSGVARKVLGISPLMTAKESGLILELAREAYGHGRGVWPAMSGEARIQSMEAFLGRMIVKREDISTLLMWEIGKSLRDARSEFDRTVRYTKETIEAFTGLDRKSPHAIVEQGIVGRVGRAPLGAVLCMGPFNYPLFETFTALVPALLAGNVVIFKTPRYGSLLFEPLLDAFRDSFPPGTVNIISGDGREIIPPLISSGGIDGLAFIGTSAVAARLRALHPKPQRLRCILGLEAKNPAILLPDADLEATVRESVSGALAFNGQRCAALKVFFVHTSVVREFLDRFCRALEGLRLGMPWEDGVSITPLVEPAKPGYLEGLVADAVSLGAEVMNHGGGIGEAGFFRPALLYPVTPAMRVFREEQFGPLIPVVPYDDLEEPVRLISESDYGQQASVFGRDKGRLKDIVGFLLHQVSRVNINCQCQRSPDSAPFTGRKDSGEGSLSVSDGITAFSIPSFVSARDTGMDREIIEILSNE